MFEKFQLYVNICMKLTCHSVLIQKKRMNLSWRILQKMGCGMCMGCRMQRTVTSNNSKLYMNVSFTKIRYFSEVKPGKVTNYATNMQSKNINSVFFKKILSRLFVSTPTWNTSKEDAASNTQKKDAEKNDTKWLTVPNILTFGRLLVSPYIGYLVLQEHFTFAFGLVLLAGVTDSLDGWIARKFKGQSSNIGSYIDPLADKVMISILTLSLTMVNIIPLPLCALIIARDILLVATSSHFHYKHLEPPKTMAKFFDFENSKVKMEPTQISKYNTFLQLGLVGFSSAAPVFGLVDHPLLQAYWYLVASTTVLSGLSYVVKDKSAYIIK